jgi:hypothetical protein
MGRKSQGLSTKQGKKILTSTLNLVQARETEDLQSQFRNPSTELRLIVRSYLNLLVTANINASNTNFREIWYEHHAMGSHPIFTVYSRYFY